MAERSRRILLGMVLAIALGGLVACRGEDGSWTWPTIPVGPQTLVQDGGGTRQPVAFKPKPASPRVARAARDLLRLGDVEKLSGFVNLTYYPRDPSLGASGDVNIARPNGGMLVMMNVGGRAMYELSKASAYYDRDLPGIGDSAYVGPSRQSSGHDYIVAARKGNRAVILTTYFDPGGRSGPPLLSADDLKKLARLAVSRM